jgi:multiple sugar transport system permease protein
MTHPSGPKKALLYAILALYLVFVLFPILWLIQCSFKTSYQALQVPPLLIWKPTLDAYRKVFGGGIYKALLNSVTVGVSNVILCLAFGIPAAYGLSRIRTKISENMGFYMISIRFAPLFAVILPLYIIFRTYRMLDRLTGVVIAHLIINLPLAVWLIKGYFQSIPLELEEAAHIDGASRLRVLLQITVPLGLPMIAAVSALVFLFSWNEFMLAFIITGQSARTVPVIVSSLAGSMLFDFPLLSAVSAIALIPAFVFVGYVQKHIARGFTMGAIK